MGTKVPPNQTIQDESTVYGPNAQTSVTINSRQVTILIPFFQLVKKLTT